jgi:hypothetical protein
MNYSNARVAFEVVVIEAEYRVNVVNSYTATMRGRHALECGNKLPHPRPCLLQALPRRL